MNYIKILTILHSSLACAKGDREKIVAAPEPLYSPIRNRVNQRYFIMKFTATLLLFFVLTNKSSLGQFIIVNESDAFSDNKQQAVTVLKPPYIDISQHYILYGILGPESFRRPVTFRLIKEDEIRKYGSEITLMLNDSDVSLLNGVMSTSFRMLVSEQTLVIGCFGQTKRDYNFTYLYDEPELLPANLTRLQDTTELTHDIYPLSMIVTVKSSSIRPGRKVSAPTHPFIHREFMSRVGLAHYDRNQITILDPGAIALYGNSIQIVLPFPEILEGKEYARVRLERVVMPNSIDNTPLYWIKEATPIPESQQSLLR